MYYLQSRYYDPAIGRFINADGYVQTGGINSQNMFAYCGNNPVNMSDPDGHYASHYGTPRPNSVSYSSPRSISSFYFTPRPKTSLRSKLQKNEILPKVSLGVDIGAGSMTHILKNSPKAETLTLYKVTSTSFSFKSGFRYAKQVKGLSIAATTVSVAVTGYEVYTIWENPSLSTAQKWGGTGIAVAGFGAGFAVGYLAVAAANIWNPSGWVMIGVAVVSYAAVTIAGSIAIDCASDYAYRKIGIY